MASLIGQLAPGILSQPSEAGIIYRGPATLIDEGSEDLKSYPVCMALILKIQNKTVIFHWVDGLQFLCI